MFTARNDSSAQDRMVIATIVQRYTLSDANADELEFAMSLDKIVVLVLAVAFFGGIIFLAIKTRSKNR